MKGSLPPGGPLGTGPSASARPQLPPLKELRNKETEEILKLILPPRQWEENGTLFGPGALILLCCQLLYLILQFSINVMIYLEHHMQHLPYCKKLLIKKNFIFKGEYVLVLQ